MATKERLQKFGMISDSNCCLCHQVETLDYFECSEMHVIWQNILNWLHVNHVPKSWHMELPWLVQHCNRKGWRFNLLKLVVTETIYVLWGYRNDKCFGSFRMQKNIVDQILNIIIFRAWNCKRLKLHIVKLMM